ncbi:MAG: hypothetical protein GXO00_01320 [Candidatus Diapherotrites archaeon]|nr:hypothetical protein [Candidatus Diapherotrites archaeon]
MVEKNVSVVEKNGYVVEKVGDMVFVRGGEVNRAMEEVRVQATETFEYMKRVAERLGVELNVPPEGKRIIVRERVGDKNVVTVLAVKERAVVGKKMVIDPEKKEANVEIVVLPEENGLYYVKEVIPKEGNEVDFEVNGPYVVLDFDPVIAWVAELNGEGSFSYTVKGTVPQEIEPMVSTLATCDVDVKFLDVSYVKDLENEVFSGKFQILFQGAPVYTPDVKVNGELAFVRDGMFYIFEVNGSKVIIEGSVGDCSFYRELSSPVDYLPLIVLAVLALAVVAFFLIRRG